MRIFILLAILMMSNWSYSETITIEATPSIPPFVMASDRQHHFSGFSIDIMNEICRRMRVTCLYNRVDFKNVIDSVMNNEADLAIGNISITKERQQYVLFSLPYLPSEVQFITMKDSPLATLEDLRDKKVGAEEASIFPDYIAEKYGPSVKVVPYKLLTDMIGALSSESIDAVILDTPTAQYWHANNGDVFKLLGPSTPLGLGIGIITNKANNQLIARVNMALTSMQNDGTYTNIYNTYFSNELLPH